MTANKNTNDSHQQPNEDEDWENFLSSHSSDLGNLEKSHTARKFERHAQKSEKKKLLDAADLTRDSFVRPGRPSGTGSSRDYGSGHGRGPRDFNSSWLDVDETLGDDSFTPGPPDIGTMRRGTVIFALITLVGVVGLILVAFLPSIAPLLGTICGVLTLVGAVGLIMRLRGHNETKTDPFDDGARV